MLGGPVTRLPHTRVQTEVAHQLVRRGEPCDVADSGQHAGSHDHVDAADCHQPSHPVITKADGCDRRLGGRQLLLHGVDPCQPAVHGGSLVLRQWLFGEPLPARPHEQLAGKGRDQVGVQHRMDTVLGARHALQHARPAGNEVTQLFRRLVGLPDLRQVAGGVQPGQRRRVDPVRLGLRLGDHAHLQRVGDHDPAHMRLQQPYDRHRVAGRLQHHLVLGPQRPRECQHLGAHQVHPVALPQHAVLQLRHLGKAAMQVQSDNPHGLLPSLFRSRRGQHDAYGSALAAQPGWSQGRPTTNASSQLIQ